MEVEKKKAILRQGKFILFSISAGIIQIASFTIFEEVFHLEHWLSYFIALVLSVVWNFTFNRKFTFQSANNVPIAMLKVAAYYAVFTPLSLQLEWELTYHWTFPGSPYVATGINMLINFVTEFLYQRYFVFGNSIESAKKKKDESKPSEVEETK